MPHLSRGAGRTVRIAAVLGLLVVSLGPLTAPAVAAEGLTMEAQLQLGGHARVGSWVAISVHLKNDGPAVSGELRLAGGTQGQTSFGKVVDLPTQSDQVHVLYAQPPTFGNELHVVLVDDDQTIVSAKARFQIHDATQLMVAVVAEHPEGLIGSLSLLPDRNQVAPLVVSISPDDLPERVQAWGAIDRIIWQDVDFERLSTPQRDALRGWIAGGGRLVIAGGTAGPKAVSSIPDLLLPYRPVATIDVPAANLSGMLGELPPTATTLPAWSGELIEGRVLATVGDRVVAADRAYGAGSVTLIGFDPSVDWIANTDVSQGLWRRLLPARTSGGLAFFDDSMLVQAVSQLPSLALPPVSGLLLLLGAYILLIGPINYLVLKRLDRREWAWFTMPILILIFAAGAYAYGAVLRGSDMIVNEVAIVRGAPGATDGTAQVYLGIFSPSRGVYQVRVPGGALLSTPINGDFGGGGTGRALDVLQGDPSRVRNLAVGFGALRAIRADTAVAVPLIHTDLRLEDGRLTGTVKNASSQRLERPAVVFGQTVAVLGDLEPGAEASVSVRVEPNRFGQNLADRIVGQVFFGDPTTTPDTARLYVRHSMVDQLTSDPTTMGPTNQLPADGPVVLAWGSTGLLGVEIENQAPRHLGNVLYYLPAPLAITGRTSFSSDLIRSTVIDGNAVVFTRERMTLEFGRGNTTVAYRPVALDGTIAATELTIGLNADPGSIVKPAPVGPIESIPPPCPDPTTEECIKGFDNLPEVEVFDVEARTWRRLTHLSSGIRYAVTDPARYVDSTSGTVLVRYVNERNEGVGFSVDVSITGDVR